MYISQGTFFEKLYLYINIECGDERGVRKAPVQTLRLMMTSRKRRGCCCCYISDDPLRLFLEADDNCVMLLLGLNFSLPPSPHGHGGTQQHKKTLGDSAVVPTPYLFEANQMGFFVLYICWDDITKSKYFKRKIRTILVCFSVSFR